MDDAYLNDLTQRFADVVLRGLRPRAAFALETGVRAAEGDGLGGVIMITLPEKAKGFVEIGYSTADLANRP